MNKVPDRLLRHLLPVIALPLKTRSKSSYALKVKAFSGGKFAIPADAETEV